MVHIKCPTCSGRGYRVIFKESEEMKEFRENPVFDPNRKVPKIAGYQEMKPCKECKGDGWISVN